MISVALRPAPLEYIAPENHFHTFRAVHWPALVWRIYFPGPLRGGGHDIEDRLSKKASLVPVTKFGVY